MKSLRKFSHFRAKPIIALATLSLASSVYANICVNSKGNPKPQYKPLSTYIKKWPSMIGQTVPTDNSMVFCGSGVIYANLPAGYLGPNQPAGWTQIGTINDYYNLHFVQHGTNGDGVPVGDVEGGSNSTVTIFGQTTENPYTPQTNFIATDQNNKDVFCLTSPSVINGTDNSTTFSFSNLGFFYNTDPTTGQQTSWNSTYFYDLNLATGEGSSFNYNSNLYIPLPGLPVGVPNGMVVVNYNKMQSSQCNFPHTPPQ